MLLTRASSNWDNQAILKIFHVVGWTTRLDGELFLFGRQVLSDSLWPHGLQHARFPCPSLSPALYSNSHPSSRWCHPTISSSIVPLSSCLLPSIRVFSNESVLRIRWPEYWSFSFNVSPSNEYSGLISFRKDWLDLLAVQGTLESCLQHHSLKASNPQHSAFLMVQLSHPYLTTGKTIALTIWIVKDLWFISSSATN